MESNDDIEQDSAYPHRFVCFMYRRIEDWVYIHLIMELLQYNNIKGQNNFFRTGTVGRVHCCWLASLVLQAKRAATSDKSEIICVYVCGTYKCFSRGGIGFGWMRMICVRKRQERGHIHTHMYATLSDKTEKQIDEWGKMRANVDGAAKGRANAQKVISFIYYDAIIIR